jgi:hypothetical protein
VIFAYADPPYIGQAKRRYGKEKSYAGEVDHAQLILSLADYDGWALSASSPSLPVVLGLCPPGVRVGAWVKPFAIFKPGVNPAYAWEPVIFSGGRKRDRKEPTVRDWVSANITLKRGLCGVKPEAFCFWLFDLLGMTPHDEFVDLFPGTGAVAAAWEKWKAKGDATPGPEPEEKA